MVKKFKDLVNEASEEQLLSAYLNSRGINPRFVTKDTKIAHAKSSEYLKWKNDHQNDNKFAEETLYEGTDKEDVLSFDIPLFIRILELAREDVKEDMELHRITERLLSIRKKGVMTMDDYDFIAGLKKIKEELESLDEVSMSNLSPAMQAHVKRGRTVQVNLGDKTDKPKISPIKKIQPKKTGFLQKIFAGEQVNEWKTTKGTALDRFRAAAAEREKKHNAIEKARQEKLHQDPSIAKVTEPKAKDGMTAAIDRLEKHLNKEETVNEHGDPWERDSKGKAVGSKALEVDNDLHIMKHGKDLQGNPVKVHNVKSAMKVKDVVKSAMKMMNKEDVYQDSQAATQTSFDGANNPDDCTCDKKKQMSKSARIIKALYKKKGMKESADGQAGGGIMYDKEKTDKPEVTYGKKPTVTKAEKGASTGDNAPQAAAILTGGKTLTGQNRDTLEIDPLMKKPGPPMDQNKNINKQ